MRTLLIDNHDSYTYNLFHLVARTYGVRPTVLMNDSEAWADVCLDDFDAIVISPGPGHPQRDRDVGHAPEAVLTGGLPVLGVCLGHQMLAWLTGGQVVPAPQPRHGHVGHVRHAGDELFADIPERFVAVRYHSLCVAEPLPAELMATAWSEDGVVMALRHRVRPWFGVQFHPESVATEYGATLLTNFRRAVEQWRGRSTGRSPSTGRRPSIGRGDVAPQEPSRRVSTHDRGCAHVRRLDYAVGTESAFKRLFAGSRYAFWLDSSRVAAGLSRWSFLGDAGAAGGEILRAEVGAGHVEVLDSDGRTVRRLPGSIFDVLDARLAQHAAAVAVKLPFDLPGGYVGYFGYEMKAHKVKGECSSANTHQSPHPDAQWIAARRLLAVDHQTGTTWVVALCDQDPVTCASARSWVARTAQRLPANGSAARENGSSGHGAGPSTTMPAVDPESWLNRSREEYLADIAECHRALLAGESYEICLTTTLELSFQGSALEMYLRLRQVNPAPYAAYLRFDDLEVLCSSPERFVKIDADRMIESKPIKGTAPRSLDPASDRALAEELARSTKTRAENLMITDLVRNDLGRVCEVGTVVVPAFMDVESYATVHQLVSTIRGRLRHDVSAVAAVRACFPGGSMTGAPKERTMEIIDRLEVGPRGVYSGTLGFFGLSGAADLNIVIRTAVVRENRLSIGAGGAIVLGSDAEEEFAEMLLKACTPLRAIRPGEVGAPADVIIRRGEPA